ncbi:GLPGLI family protein [Hymenobacter sp. 102]|uniref:GLPGLI family protein n=1 Tax=Hymenobacter sp. 102 TaxID=3403152 RepID=UPI003CF1F0E8
MKKQILLYLLFTVILLSSSKFMSMHPSSAKIIFLYRMTSRPDSTSKATWTELTQLAISDSISEFRSIARYKADSLINKYQHTELNSPLFHEGMNEMDNLPRYKFDGIVIKNFKYNTCTYFGTIGKVISYYQEKDYPMKWRISSDTTTINGYRCQRAYTSLGGRDYAVWFTRQLPFSNGPYKFGGLPGLIIQAVDKTNSYRFELTHMYKPAKEYAIRMPQEVMTLAKTTVNVSKNKYYTSYFDYKNNFIENITNNGMVQINNMEAFKKNHLEKLKKRNNPIELKY